MRKFKKHLSKQAFWSVSVLFVSVVKLMTVFWPFSSLIFLPHVSTKRLSVIFKAEFHLYMKSDEIILIQEFFLTHLFAMHLFSTPWKHQKTSDVFRRRRNDGNVVLTVLYHIRVFYYKCVLIINAAKFFIISAFIIYLTVIKLVWFYVLYTYFICIHIYNIYII